MPRGGYASCTTCSKTWEGLSFFDHDRLIAVCRDCESLVSVDRFLRQCPKDASHSRIHNKDIFEKQTPSFDEESYNCPFCHNSTISFSSNMIYSRMPPDELLEKAKIEYGKNRHSFEATIHLANLLFRGVPGGQSVDYYKWAKDLIEDEEIKRELDKRILWIGELQKNDKAKKINFPTSDSMALLARRWAFVIDCDRFRGHGHL